MKNSQIHNILFNSGLYDVSSGTFINYSTKKGNGGVIYPEITAYSLSLMSILYKKTNNIKYLDVACGAASYLIKMAKENNGGIAGPKPLDKTLYTFDTGIYISGLIDLYEITNDKLYLESAIFSVNWLVKHFEGYKFLPTNKLCGNTWDLQSSIHLIKLAIPLLKVWLHTNNNKYLDYCERLLLWGKDLQKLNGRFVMNYNNDKTMLHPHCYALEGYLFAYFVLKKRKYLNIVKKGVDWLVSVQNKDGSFQRWYPNPPLCGFKSNIMNFVITEEPFDVPSQFIRLCKVLGLHKKECNLANKYILLHKNILGLNLVNKKLFGFRLKPDVQIWSWPTMFYIHSQTIKFGDKSKMCEVF